MKHLAFFQEIRKEIKPSYVFCGSEEYVKESALNALVATLPEETQAFNLERMGENSTTGQVYTACETLPMLADRRVVIWKDPKVLLSAAGDQELAAVKELLANLPPTTCLIIYLTGQIDKRRKAFTMLKNASTVVAFDPLDEFEAVRWVTSTAKKAGKEIAAKDAQLLVEQTGTSIQSLKGELDKLIAHAGERSLLTQEDFALVTGRQVNFNAFAMLDKLLNGKAQEGMAMYYALIADGVSPFMLMGAAASKLRQLYSAKCLLQSGMKSAQVISELGGNFGAKQAVNACKNYGLSFLKQAVDNLMTADYQIKNGVMKEDAAVETAMVKAFVLSGSAD